MDQPSAIAQGRRLSAFRAPRRFLAEQVSQLPHLPLSIANWRSEASRGVLQTQLLKHAIAGFQG